MQAYGEIQNILNEIDPGKKNRVRDLYMNIIHNEFIMLDGGFNVPRIPAGELPLEIATGIVKDIAGYIPEYLAGSILMKEKTPPSHQHSIQFIKKVKGRALDFVHYFDVDLKFSGDSSTVIERGNTDYYPSFSTDRIYFKSRLVPVTNARIIPEETEFSPVRIRDINRVEADEYFHTFAMFEDVNTKELSRELCGSLPESIFNISTSLYPFIVYEFFTACMSVPQPVPSELARAAEVFEPLFIFLFSRYKPVTDLLSTDMLEEHFSGMLELRGDEIFISDEFTGSAAEYFHRFGLFRDDDLTLRGWWGFHIQ